MLVHDMLVFDASGIDILSPVAPEVGIPFQRTEHLKKHVMALTFDGSPAPP